MDITRLQRLAGVDILEEKAPPGMEDVVLALKKKYPDDMKKVYSIAWSQYNDKKKNLKEDEDRLKKLSGIEQLNEVAADKDPTVKINIGTIKVGHEVDTKKLAKKFGGKLDLNLGKDGQAGEATVTFKEDSWNASNEKAGSFKKAYADLKKGKVIAEIMSEYDDYEDGRPLATDDDAMREYGANAGKERPDSAWILDPRDVWVKNPHYDGPEVPHPDDESHYDDLDSDETFAEPDYSVDTWFERDNAQVTLYKGGEEVASWSDDEVRELVDDGFLSPKDWKGSAIEYAKHLGLIEGKSSIPLQGHAYHKKTDDELNYIIKDAGEAAKAMKGQDDKAESKYLDQVNDASTVLNYRKKNRVDEAELPDALKKKVFKSEPKLDVSGDGTQEKTEIAPNGVETLPVDNKEVDDVDDRNHKTVEKDETDKVKVNAEVFKIIDQRIKELADAIELYDDKGFNDKSTKQSALDALNKIKEHLKNGTRKDVNDAKIFFTTLMSPITDMLPPKLAAHIATLDNGMMVMKPANGLNMKEVEPFETLKSK